MTDLHEENRELAARVAALEALLREKTDQEEKLRPMGMAVESSMNGISMTDMDGVVTYANPAVLRMWGYDSPSEVLGRPAASFWEDPEAAQAVIDVVMEQGGWAGEMNGVKKDGAKIMLQLALNLITDASGASVGTVASFLDVTSRVRTEAALQHSEVRYRELFENMNSGVALYEAIDDGADFVLKDLNRAGERIENVRREDVIDRPVTKVFPGLEAFGALDMFRRVWKTGTPEQLPCAQYRDERGASWRECQVYKLPSNEIVAVYDDVSARKEAEDNLLLFKLVVENASDGIGMATPDGRHYYQNKAFDALFGDIGENPPETLYADPKAGEAVFNAIKSGQPWKGEVKMRARDGSIRDIALRAYAVKSVSGKILGLVGLHPDITERKRAEEELRSFVQAVENASDGIGFATPDGKHYYQNKALEDMFGAIGENPWETVYVNPEVGQKVFNTVRRGLPWNGEVQMRAQNGDILEILLRAYAVRDEDGAIRCLVGLHTDITARKRAEAALREARDLFETAVTQSPSGIVIADAPDVTLRLANHAAFAIRGGDTSKLVGIDLSQHSQEWQVFHTDGSPYPPEELPLTHAVLRGEITRDKELIIRDEEGRDHWVTVNAAPVRDGNGTITAGIALFHDMTERHQALEEREKLQVQLAQSRKMESLGRLAGGVAHDFNNMLMVILGYTDLVLEKLHAVDPVHADLTEIRAAALRSAELTAQLLAFARKQTRTPVALNLNDTIADLLNMLRRLIGEHIEFTWTPDPGVGPVHIDPAQLNQVLANLCVNARDAITGTGKISIETRQVACDAEYALAHPECAPGDYAVLIVTDNGCGMDRNTLNNLFEPFFTTKEPNKGTGLGMATVYGIIKQNNGFINVYSEPGLGSCIKVYLPLYTGQEEAPKTPDLPDIPTGSGQTVLLVEDEPAILKMGLKILERLGYTVLTANAPVEALRIAREHQGPIHLLLTDMIMPGMNGVELARQFLPLFPRARVVFMSGYTAENIAHHGVLNEGVHFLQKPFSMDTLALKVYAALEEIEKD